MDGAKPRITTFACPNCQSTIPVRGLGQTTTAACGSCGSIIDISTPNYEIIQKFQREAAQPTIPLGTRGKIFDTLYEVIGYLRRCDATREYFWEEYLLFNPYKGFAWLAQSQGHWNFLKSVKDINESPDLPKIEYQKTTFKRFLVDTPKVVSVLGEFYWRIQAGDEVASIDYISPPFILSCEVAEDETVWSFGQYLTPSEIEEAFALEFKLSKPEGVAANQINRWKERLIYTIPIFALAFLLAQIFHHRLAPSYTAELLQQSFTYQPGTPPSPIYSSEIEVTRETTNLAIDLSAPVDNSWLDVDVDLVNPASSEIRDQSLEVAYYHGSDSDGSWTEGSTHSRYYFTSVAPGRYYLTLTPTADPIINLNLPFQISVTQGIGSTGNIATAILFLALVPAICLGGMVIFERLRWEQSSEVSQ